jgi:phage/plasmid-like protein (TIGR03299 family)
MTQETSRWLAENLRIGYTDERGPAWWAAGTDQYLTDGSHFPGSVPEAEVRKILGVPLVEGTVNTVYRDTEDQRQVAEDKSRKTIVRADTGDILGIFKSGYKIHGYQEWTADQLAAITDQGHGELGVASVGLLKKGAVAFIQAKLEGTGLEVAGYEYTPFILAATSCDGSLASSYATGVIGAVCDNTLAAALRSAHSKLKVKHSRNSAGRIGEVRDALGLVYTAGEDFAASVEELVNVDISEADFAAWMDEIAGPVPADKGASRTLNLSKRQDYAELRSDPKVRPWDGTAFGLVQLDNTYRTWTRTVKGADGGRMERNLVNTVTGVGDREDAAAMAAIDKIMARRSTFALAAA